MNAHPKMQGVFGSGPTMPLSLHPAAVTLVLKKLSLYVRDKFICHFSTNTGSILSLLLRKEPDIYTSIIGAHYRQETEPDLGFFPMLRAPPPSSLTA